MRRGCRISVAIVAALALAGCGSRDVETAPVGDTAGWSVDVVTITVSGTPLTCVAFWVPKAGGPSCDWQGWHADRMPK